MMPLCQIRNLVWQPGDKKILNIQELTIEKGERIALIGPNGAGKSSLLKVLTFLLKKDVSGSINYPGFQEQSELSIRRNISAVFQDANLLSGNVSDNVALGLKLRGYNKNKIVDKLSQSLEEFKIANLAKRNVRILSKGESQRVSLARALITDPKFLLLDEPFSNLDVPTRSEILIDISDIVKRKNLTLVMITHYPAEIPIISDRVLVMDNGEIVEEGTPFQVLERPKRSVTAKLVGIDNIFSGYIDGDSIQIDSVGLLNIDPLNKAALGNKTAKRKAEIFIRPDLIQLYTGQKYNNLDFKISKIVPMHDAYLLNSSTMPMLFRISRNNYLKNKFYVGQDIRLHIPVEAIIIGEIGSGTNNLNG